MISYYQTETVIISINLKAKEWFEVYCYHWLQQVLISGGDKRYLTRQGPGAKTIVWVWQLFDQVSPLNCLGMAMAKTVRPS